MDHLCYQDPEIYRIIEAEKGRIENTLDLIAAENHAALSIMIVAGASAYARLIDYRRLADISQNISAYLLVDMAHIAGLVAASVIPSPVPVSDFVTFTTYKTLMGGRGGVIISKEKYCRHIDRAVFPGIQGTPALNQVAAKAVCFHLADTPEFTAVQKRIVDNAAVMADEFKKRGYRLVSGGTDNHMVLVDLRSKKLIGREAEKMLESTGIIVNRNVIPNDPQSPDKASGIRVGASAISARGIETAEARHIVGLIDAVLSSCGRRETLDHVASEVASICRDFPVYP